MRRERARGGRGASRRGRAGSLRRGGEGVAARPPAGLRSEGSSRAGPPLSGIPRPEVPVAPRRDAGSTRAGEGSGTKRERRVSAGSARLGGCPLRDGRVEGAPGGRDPRGSVVETRTFASTWVRENLRPKL